MREQRTQIANIANATGSGEGDYVGTRETLTVAGESKARVFLNVTALAGTTPLMDVTIVALVAGADQVIASFVQSTEGVSQQSIVIDACPSTIKAVYTAGGIVTDFDATVDVIRF